MLNNLLHEEVSSSSHHQFSFILITSTSSSDCYVHALHMPAEAQKLTPYIRHRGRHVSMFHVQSPSLPPSPSSSSYANEALVTRSRRLLFLLPPARLWRKHPINSARDNEEKVERDCEMASPMDVGWALFALGGKKKEKGANQSTQGHFS